MGIGKNKLKVVGEPLESRPFARGHFAYTFTVDLSFDVGNRGKIGKAIVYDQVSLPAHASADESGRYTVEILDFIAESMTRSLVSGPVLPKSLQIHVAEVVLHRDGFLLHDVCNFRLRVGGLRELE